MPRSARPGLLRVTTAIPGHTSLIGSSVDNGATAEKGNDTARPSKAQQGPARPQELQEIKLESGPNNNQQKASLFLAEEALLGFRKEPSWNPLSGHIAISVVTDLVLFGWRPSLLGWRAITIRFQQGQM